MPSSKWMMLKVSEGKVIGTRYTVYMMILMEVLMNPLVLIIIDNNRHWR